MTTYAHSRNDAGVRQLLVDHLREVARRTTEFASVYADPATAAFLGYAHDIGKISPAWQEYLLASEAGQHPKAVDHKAAGTKLAADRLGLALLVVHGHHGGLQEPAGLKSWLAEQLAKLSCQQALAAANTFPELAMPGPMPMPDWVQADRHAFELWLRLLFSALVDADCLDTEQHFSPEKALVRPTSSSLSDLWRRYQTDQQRLVERAVAAASSSQGDGGLGARVQAARRAVYQACLEAAEAPPGLFRLAVPTGGGKTRSSMGFALSHALSHGLKRIIVAVPFISITEQTAQVFRDIFEEASMPPVVLEHHSGVTSDEDDQGEQSKEAMWRRLVAENWDAPVVVTTTVQLFESLFSSATSKVRKLHNLAESVLILDEVQSLPAHLLRPILDVLRELASHYHCTVVLSTATQPAFDSIPEFAGVAAQDIVPNAERLFRDLRRVTYEWCDDLPLPWADVAGIMREQPQVLAVLNTKRDAMALLDALNDPEAMYLSTSLCGAHRRDVIAKVKDRLATGQPCRLISTQVIEAGVDLDFPLVLRALAPLDAIIQAAGRCNREGKLGAGRGRVIVFRPDEGGMPRGAYATGAGISAALYSEGKLDPDEPTAARGYFRRLYDTLGALATDRERIQETRASFDYPEVARRFRMIDEDAVSVAVTTYGEARRQVLDALELLRRGNHPGADARTLLRTLQPFLVSLRRREAERYHREGLLSWVLPELGEWHGKYDPVRGLLPEDPDASALIA
jgi:CRISPR-associated endonuclease/helicase Cas3